MRWRRWQCVGGVGDVGNASATLAMRRRRWQCVGDVGNASATLAIRLRRRGLSIRLRGWQSVQYVCEVGNTLLTLVMRS